MIDTFVKDGKTYTKLENLKIWEDNPRGIKTDDFDRLKKQIIALGQYKPNLIMDDGTTLGGNMRTRAYKYLLDEYKNLGPDVMADEKHYDVHVSLIEKTITDIKAGIWISIVHPKNEQEKVEYALSDNDRAGYYEDESLLELVSGCPDLDLSQYKVDLGMPVSLERLLETEPPVDVPDEDEDSAPVDAVSKAGATYKLGSHRLICGDKKLHHADVLRKRYWKIINDGDEEGWENGTQEV